jgi:hypothetical protein
MRKEIDNMENLKWCVLNYDFNSKQIIYFNIFNNWRFKEAAIEAVKEFKESVNQEVSDLVAKIDSLAKWQFWCRREYEISAGDLYEHDLNRYERVDVYQQIEMNIDNLVNYLLNVYNNINE